MITFGSLQLVCLLKGIIMATSFLQEQIIMQSFLAL